MNTTNRFLRYVKIHTTSDDQSTSNPSSEIQLELAQVLKDEMTRMGFSDVFLSKTGYVNGKLPASAGLENKPTLGLISHMDTSPDFSGEKVTPQFIEKYDGKDIPLGNSGRILSTVNFPELLHLKGRTVITTDGTTLLGADDKAGIAEILTACEQIITQKLPHCALSVCFTPDEEVGRGPDHFDLQRFGAKYAFTVDGGETGELSYENFNAAAATVHVKGFNIHPGDAKNKMINALLVLCEFNSMLPSAEIPRGTEGREGFYHLTSFEGSIEKAVSSYIIRDHHKGFFESRKHTMKQIEKNLNEKYGSGTVQVNITDQYENMEEIIRSSMFLIEKAEAAMRQADIEPRCVPTRGGTDGARLSFMGLPCPNLCTGGYAFHGPYEHITVEDMDKCAEILTNLIQEFSK